eukprot:103417_1
MAYDSYKQNQKHTQAQKKKNKKQKQKTKPLKPGLGHATTVGSASAPDHEIDGIETRKKSSVDEPFINVFDEDEDGKTPIGTDDDDGHNPFMDDDIIKTGQTLIDDDGALAQTDVMSAFDED